MHRREATRFALGLIALAVAAVALLAQGCTPQKAQPGTSPGSGVATTTPSTTTTDVPATSLPQMREGLLFTWVQKGGMKEVEKQAGKPTTTYKVPATDPSGGSVEFADGRAYRFEFGFTSSGATVVVAHTVEGVTGKAESTTDKAFVAAITDGKTTVDEANRYISKVSGGTIRRAAPDPKALTVPASAWYLADGSGFVVLDLTGLTPQQMESIGMGDEGPYQAMYWDPSHWYAYDRS